VGCSGGMFSVREIKHVVTHDNYHYSLLFPEVKQINKFLGRFRLTIMWKMKCFFKLGFEMHVLVSCSSELSLFNLCVDGMTVYENGFRLL
jgi:hypothetical protein